jgi:hypothetical protein
MTCEEFHAIAKNLLTSTKEERVGSRNHYAGCESCQQWVADNTPKNMTAEEILRVTRAVQIIDKIDGVDSVQEMRNQYAGMSCTFTITITGKTISIEPGVTYLPIESTFGETAVLAMPMDRDPTETGKQNMKRLFYWFVEKGFVGVDLVNICEAARDRMMERHVKLTNMLEELKQKGERA